MPCKEICVCQRNSLAEDSEWRNLALELFLMAHRMLRNFVDLLKLRLAKCCNIDCDWIPLHGALDVVGKAMRSMMRQDLLKKELQRPGLFYDIFCSKRCCETRNIAEPIIHKVETILKRLEKLRHAEDISNQARDVLIIMQTLPPDIISERLQILSFLLMEITKRVACCGDIFEESLNNAQMKMVLKLVNNVIQDWIDKRLRINSRIKICRFCDNIINEVARQWGIFCCRDAEHLNEIWKEWGLRESIWESARSKGREDIELEHLGKRDSGDEASKRSVDVETAKSEDRERASKFDYEGRSKRMENAGKEKRSRKMEGEEDGDERGSGWRGRKKGKEDADKLSKNKEDHQRKKKRADALDTERGRMSYNADEEGKVLKRDGKRSGRRTRKEGTDYSDLTMKRKGVRVEGGKVKADKSTLKSESRKKTEEDRATKKGSRVLDSTKTLDDDYSKTNGSRYHGEKSEALNVIDIEMGPPNRIEYQLSNEYFLKLGWTVLPVTKTMRKIVQYQARIAKPHLDWFKKRRYDGPRFYDDDTTPFLTFRSDGSGEVHYQNGKTAIKVYRAKDEKYDMYTVFSPGGKDSMGIERESQIAAIFDTIGNGAVFDEDGAARLSYNQIGGICADNPNGLPFVWTWNKGKKTSMTKTVYAERLPTYLEELLPTLFFTADEKSKRSGSVKAPMSTTSSGYKEKKVVEPVVGELEEEVESGSESGKHRPQDLYPGNRICMKLNKHLSLRILDQRNINLRFVDGNRNIRIELGTILNHDEKQATHFVDSRSIKNILKSKFEDILSNEIDSDSIPHGLIQELQKIQEYAKHRERIKNKYGYNTFLDSFNARNFRSRGHH